MSVTSIQSVLESLLVKLMTDFSSPISLISTHSMGTLLFLHLLSTLLLSQAFRTIMIFFCYKYIFQSIHIHLTVVFFSFPGKAGLVQHLSTALQQRSCTLSLNETDAVLNNTSNCFHSWCTKILVLAKILHEWTGNTFFSQTYQN